MLISELTIVLVKIIPLLIFAYLARLLISIVISAFTRGS